MKHRSGVAFSLFLSFIVASMGACSEDSSPEPQVPGPVPEAQEPVAPEGVEESAPPQAERIPRMKLMLMFQSVSDFCREVTEFRAHTCASEELCRAYCERMLPDPHNDFMTFPCGGQHTVTCYEASRPESGSPAMAAARAAEFDDPASKCWQVVSHRTGKTVLGCGGARLKLVWISE